MFLVVFSLARYSSWLLNEVQAGLLRVDRTGRSAIAWNRAIELETTSQANHLHRVCYVFTVLRAFPCTFAASARPTRLCYQIPIHCCYFSIANNAYFGLRELPIHPPSPSLQPSQALNDLGCCWDMRWSDQVRFRMSSSCCRSRRNSAISPPSVAWQAFALDLDLLSPVTNVARLRGIWTFRHEQ
ncbi:uncharacterized protein K452DRAFT_300042 [Aplosporella prunicola CBS 121167]|uniref:Uncharacterized protein n=1 Tax=Aplosporella prunicola CBS 121167 TaxID=1176127 RepID=A0A6A6B7G5_9PEZI|nr:uncharacterized protein K452DRAFT_300042 [Aplosporella prunicola CBS 121167]KAF2140102.1 hypothetical protein K452DRAFT_300042 [Aplosporella prunicola CBS 121167]